MMTTEPQEPWHVHDGGGRPNKGNDYVEVVLRDGRHVSLHSAAVEWPWQQPRDPYDVIRWRYAEEPPTPWVALKQAAAWFEEYAAGHAAKGATEKQQRNLERAAYCRRAAGERV